MACMGGCLWLMKGRFCGRSWPLQQQRQRTGRDWWVFQFLLCVAAVYHAQADARVHIKTTAKHQGFVQALQVLKNAIRKPLQKTGRTYVFPLFFIWERTLGHPRLPDPWGSVHRPIGALQIQARIQASKHVCFSCCFFYFLTWWEVFHLAGVVLWPWNFPEAFIQRKVVANGVLKKT